MKAQLDKDRRSDPRIPVTVKCWLERESITLLGTITNISPGGLFFRTPVSVAEGSDVDLRVTLGDEIISVKGQVAWTAPAECKPGHLGLGIGLKESVDGNSLFRRVLDAKEDKLR